MFKMIVADDEAIVRQGMRNILNWQDYNIEIIGEASDGQEAYQMCLENKVDILFTDIRMPFLDGLELATKIKEENMNIKIIFFSGIQDFNYAKTALDICAEAYILKPLEEEDLKEAINKVTEKLFQEIDRENKLLTLEQQLHESFGPAREKFLINLVLGIFKSETEIMSKLHYFNNPFRADENFSVAVLKIDDYASIVSDKSEFDKQLLSFGVINIGNEIIKEYTSAISFIKDENEVVIIFNVENFSKEKYNRVFQEINSSVKKYLKISTSIGIGNSSKNVLDMNSLYKSAFDALQFKFYTGKDSIINASDIKLDYEKDYYKDLYVVEMQLLKLIKLGDMEGEKKLLDEIFKDFITDKRYTISNVQDSCVEIIFMAIRSISETGEKLENIVVERSKIMGKIYDSESISDLKAIMLDIFDKITNHFYKKYNQKNSKLVEAIKDIIEKRYMEDLSVNKISEMVFLTPNYISLIFKHEMGESITDYITKIRIEAAKELLKAKDLKILDVSAMVGYEDASYFSKVFKKYTGVYPQKYRNNFDY